jgi:hypothetical protein
VGPPDGLDPGLRQAEVAHLAFLDQLLDRAGHVLDRNVRVDAVLVEQVHVVGTETAERALEGRTDVLRPAVQPALPRCVADREAELGRDHHIVAVRLERLADDLLVVVRAVDLRRVEEGHPVPDRLAQEVDHRVVVGRRAERLADAHAAQPDR